MNNTSYNDREDDFILNEYDLIENKTKQCIAGINPHNFIRHCYILGKTGKTTLISNIIQQLIDANNNDTFRNSIIYVNLKNSPKDTEDAYRIVKQMPKQIHNDKLFLIDSDLINFSINPLELSYCKTEQWQREQCIQKSIDDMVHLFCNWCGYDEPKYTNSETILQKILNYLYIDNDFPTLEQVHKLILKLLQLKNTKNIDEILKTIERDNYNYDTRIKQPLYRIIKSTKSDFEQILEFTEMFQNYTLKKMFNTRHSTIHLEKLVKSGMVSVININKENETKYVDLIFNTLLLKLKNIIFENKSNVPTILILDNFQVIESLPFLPEMLSFARSFNLGIVISHENISQISNKIRSSIFGNVGTGFIGKVSEDDAKYIGKMWEPEYVKQVVDGLSKQKSFEWNLYLGLSKRRIPLLWQMKALGCPPPKTIMTDENFSEFVENSKTT